MTKDDALKLALVGCIEHMEHSTPQGRAAYEAAIAALREALEQPQPDPFAHLSDADLMAMQPIAQPRRHISYVCPQCDASMVPEEQPQQEPVARVTGYYGGRCVIEPLNPALVMPDGMALYTSPPRREWVGLTDISEIVEAELMRYWNGEYIDSSGARDCLTEFARAIEARLKEKNQ